MRIGITGVTGFIGRALAAEASRRGIEVVGFSRREYVEIAGVKEFRCLSEDQVTTPDVSGLDALVHLAGESVFGLWTREKKRKILDSRVQVTRQIVQALQKEADTGCRVPVFVSASGAGFYGDRGDEVLTESSEIGQGFLAEVCREWEGEAREAEKFGTRVVNLRTGLVLGDDGGAWLMLKRVFRMYLGSVLGSGRQWSSWIHLDDEVGMILHAIQNESCNGPMNLGAEKPVTNEELTHAIARRVGRPVMPRVPAWLIKLVMGEMSEMVLGGQRMEPELARLTGYKFRFTRVEDALAALKV